MSAASALQPPTQAGLAEPPPPRPPAPPAPPPAGAREVSRAPLVAVGLAAFLVLLKGVAAWLTGSLAVGAAALDSAVDVFVSSASFFVLRESAVPPDADHPYGHGRFESLAELGQGLLLAGAAVAMIVSGIHRLGSPAPSRDLRLGVGVLAASMLASWLTSWHLGRAAAKLDSPVLHADTVHYRTDLWINAGALAALLVAHWAHWPAADPLAALLVSLVVLRAAAVLISDSVGDLSDRGLPAAELRQIETIVAGFAPEVVGLHGLRTRRSGSRRLIELHLEVPQTVSFEEAHARGARVRRAIESQLARSRVMVHCDPV